jgi:hypothetical protein
LRYPKTSDSGERWSELELWLAVVMPAGW